MTDQQSTLAANWTGETASSFGQALNQWLQDFNTVKTQLSNMLETLSQNTGIYTNTNDESTQMAQTFGSSMSQVTGLGI
jgi:WXG100 family type VII secretion target